MTLRPISVQLACILMCLFCPLSHAQQPDKTMCPTKQLNAAVKAIGSAPLCQTAMALYESCGSEVTSYDSLVAMADAARGRCEQVFMNGIGERTKRAYKKLRNKCEKQVNGTYLFLFPKLLCGPYAAADYARLYTMEREKLLNNPDPPL